MKEFKLGTYILASRKTDYHNDNYRTMGDASDASFWRCQEDNEFVVVFKILNKDIQAAATRGDVLVLAYDGIRDTWIDDHDLLIS